MSADVFERMVYSFMKPMWHGITEPSIIDMSARDIIYEKFDGAFEIFTRPITVLLNGEHQETGDFAIVRSASPTTDDFGERVFGYCTKRYTPLQPIDVADSFDRNVAKPAETMAFLNHGKEMFISWKMPSFDVVVGDAVEMYGIVRTGFDTLKGARLFTSVYRPVCANTINLAQNWAESNSDGKGKGNVWRGKGINKNLLRDLGYWMAFVQNRAVQEGEQLKNLFGLLAKEPIVYEQQVKDLLVEAYPNKDDVSDFYPDELREKKAESIDAFNVTQTKYRDGILRLFEGEGTDITPDLWGLMNATSEYFCHYLPSKRPIASSVMFGGRARSINRMALVLKDCVQ